MKLRLSDTLNSLMLGGLLMASTFASAGNKPTKPYWQDVQVVAVNKAFIFIKRCKRLHSDTFPTLTDTRLKSEKEAE